MKYIKSLSLVPLLLLSTGCIPRDTKPTKVSVGTPIYQPTPVYQPIPQQPVYQPIPQQPVYQPIPQQPVYTPPPIEVVEVHPPYTPRRSQYLGGAYKSNYKLKKFISMMGTKHNYNKSELNAIFSSVNRDKEALTKIGAFRTGKPSMSKAQLTGSWDKYRGNFLTESRINKGVQFWQENAHYLNEAFKRYGVAPEYIIGIIGVETNFGGYTGKHSVLNALTSISLEFPKRSKFFTSELENYLLMVRDEQIDPQRIKGSYAGAFGLSQFMPSSFRQYAVDLDGDGHINLFTKADAIGSVANYFIGRGKWDNQIPVAMPTYYSKSRFHGLSTGFKTRYTQSHMRSIGMRPSSSFYGYKGKVSLIKLSRYNKDEMWWGTNNFHAIARYNPKDHYAMAVHQLAQAVRQAYYKR